MNDFTYLLNELDELYREFTNLSDKHDEIVISITKITSILNQNRKNWEFLITNLKQLVESHEGLELYVSSNLTPTVRELEGKINNLDKKMFDKQRKSSQHTLKEIYSNRGGEGGI